MEKTASILHKEFSDKLIQLINNCGLPAWAIKDTLRNALNQVEAIADQEYQKDMAAYTEIEEVEE